MKSYAVIWIGTGQATGTVIPRLANAGKTVAIAEGGHVGGAVRQLWLYADQNHRRQRTRRAHDPHAAEISA